MTDFKTLVQVRRSHRKFTDQEIDAEFEYIESIDFNSLYKQYYHVIVDPAPGYIYRLRWKK